MFGIGLGRMGLVGGVENLAGQIAAMYRNSEQGVHYDISDWYTLFQDSAGTTPVTAVGQPVGLMLDKRLGLVRGVEKVVNGGFDGALSAWTDVGAKWGAVAGRAYHASSSVYGELNQAFAAVSGPAEISFNAELLSAYNSAQWFYTNAAGVIKTLPTNLAAGVSTVRYVAVDGIQKIGFSRTSGFTAEFYIDNISVRELPGNHATQPTAINRPVLSARVNLLTKTEDFSDAAWVRQDLITDGDLVTTSSIYGALRNTFGTLTVTPNTAYTFSWKAKRGSMTQMKYSVRDVTNSVDVVASTSYFDAVGAAYVLFSVTFTTPASCTSLGIYMLRDSGSIGTCYIKEPHLNPGLTSTRYQRVNTDTDYDTVGFPSYLSFNGTNSWMSTGSIDFSASDKMTVVAGVRKLSDVAFGMVAELSSVSAANIGAFYLGAPTSKVYELARHGSGSERYQSTASFAAPVSSVITGGISLSASPEVTALRVNGINSGSIDLLDSGAGNFGNYPLFIGARAGTSLFFNGNLYGLIIRGALSSDAQIASAERFMNSKTGAY